MARKKHPLTYVVQNTTSPSVGNRWNDYVVYSKQGKKAALKLYSERESVERDGTRRLWWRIISRREIVLYSAPID